MDLGSVTYCCNLIYPFLTPFFFSRFMDRLFPPISYLLPIYSCSSSKPYPILPTTHLLYQYKAVIACTLPVPATQQPSPLIPAPRAACLRLPPFTMKISPPISLRSLSYLGVCLSWVTQRLCVPDSPSLSSPSNIGITWSLVSCQVDFCARERGQGASTPWKLRVLVLYTLPVLGHAVTIPAIRMALKCI